MTTKDKQPLTVEQIRAQTAKVEEATECLEQARKYVADLNAQRRADKCIQDVLDGWR